MRKLPTRKLLATIIAGALFIPNTGFTLGLGEIEVNSALNQRLNADIELLSTTPEDAESLIVKLASRKEFTRAGLDRPYLLNDLRFKSETVDGVSQIKVSSSSPIREPFLNFLLEIDWPNGHLLREYTVLLDPPVFMTQAASTVSVQSTDDTDFRPTASAPTNTTPVVEPVAAPMPVVQTAPVAETISPAKKAVKSTPTFIPAPVVQKQTPIKQADTSYRIKSGDTAWKLADAMRPNQNVSVPQMMLALLRANPETFINGNINGIKRGYILRAPDASQITSISQADARAMVREHSALWRQYRSGAQSAPVMSAVAKPASTGAGASSGASDAAVSNEAHLAIVAGAGTGTSGVAGKDPSDMSAQELRAELALARERVETERVEKEELKQRVDTLEQQSEKMQGMLTIENKGLSNVQSLNSPNDDSAVDAKDNNAEMPVAEGSAITDETAASVATENASEETATATEELVVEGASEEAIFTDQITDQTAEVDPISEDSVMPEDVGSVMTDSETSEDPLTQLLNNPTLLAAAGGGLLLIIAMIALINKRRKQVADSTVSAAPVMSSASELESLADDLAEETAIEAEDDEEDMAENDRTFTDDDMDAETIEEAGDAQVEPEAAAEEARDDVIAEADVYLAYGIYQQAEDLLKQALSENPENDNYRVKLAETHYTSKNTSSFLAMAGELKDRVGTDSAMWNKVLVMGQDMCADDPMFQGEMVAELNLDATSDDELALDFEPDGDAVSDDSFDSAEDIRDEALELPDLDAKGLGETEEDASDLSVEPADEIEFDLSDTDAVEEEADADDEFSLDINVSELDVSVEDEAVNETGGEEESFDLSDIDIGLDEDDAPADEAELDIPLDMSDDTEEVELDLSEEIEDEITDTDLSEEANVAAAANDGSAEEGDFDLSSIDDVDEISTKLDLARAYLDMGDHDGTRDILEEVLVDGNDDQKQEANDLMEKLG